MTRKQSERHEGTPALGMLSSRRLVRSGDLTNPAIVPEEYILQYLRCNGRTVQIDGTMLTVHEEVH
jgi:hypothetical protein